MQTYSDNWEVQYAQRVASNGISLLQNGQTFTVGAASVFFFPKPAALLMTFIRQNKIKAIIMKFTTADKNEIGRASCRERV